MAAREGNKLADICTKAADERHSKQGHPTKRGSWLVSTQPRDAVTTKAKPANSLRPQEALKTANLLERDSSLHE